MRFVDKAKSLLGKAMRPLHAGEQKLLSHRPDIVPDKSAGPGPQRIQIQSDAFTDGQQIPVRHSAEGANVSPPLTWSSVPDTARELVLVVEDPDAPMPMPFVHWIVRGISPQSHGLPEGGMPATGTAQPAEEGINSRSEQGYVGPIPPPGHGPHRYHFELFALDQPLSLEGPADRDSLRKAMAGHVVAFGDLVGTYERK
jgi:Raf kinase inhibitor-like YbhB/YbcL family protein